MKKKIALVIALVLVLAAAAAFAVHNREQEEVPASLENTEDTEPVMLAHEVEEQGKGTQELTHKVEVEKYSQNELEALFEQSYQNIHTDPVKLKMALVSPAIIAVEGVDEQYIIIELDELRNISNPDKLPQDYPTQYRSWREAYIAAMLAKAEYISSLFEEVEEEVYTLNETTPYSTFDENTIEIKDAGDPIKKGTPLTRTGKGTQELAEWSRCLDADGNTVYILTIDLTTDKPVTGGGNGNGGGSGLGSGGSGTGGNSQQQQPSSGAITNPNSTMPDVTYSSVDPSTGYYDPGHDYSGITIAG